MAEDRKARLASLAARAGRSSTQNNEVGDNHNCRNEEIQSNYKEMTSEDSKKKSVKFRNYAPNDDALEKTSMEPSAKRSRQNDSRRKNEDENVVRNELEIALIEAKNEAADAVQDSSVLSHRDSSAINLVAASKKVNWDLKRDILKKINRLERRTQKAVVDLLRSRLEKEADVEGNDSDLD